MKRFIILLIVFLISNFSIFAQDTILYLVEDFNDSINLNLWEGFYDIDSTILSVKQVDGYLDVNLNQEKFYDGHSINFYKSENNVFDLTDFPYVSFDFKLNDGAIYDSIEKVAYVDFNFEIFSFISENHTGKPIVECKRKIPADNKWHHYFLDFDIFYIPGYDGISYSKDFRAIMGFTIRSMKFNNLLSCNYSIDNFIIGKKANNFKIVNNFEENFEDSVNLSLWRPTFAGENGNINEVESDLKNGYLESKIEWNKLPKSKLNESQLRYNFTFENNTYLDISENPSISFDMRIIDCGDTNDGETQDITLGLSTYAFYNVNDVCVSQIPELQKSSKQINIVVPYDKEWHHYNLNLKEAEKLSRIEMLEFVKDSSFCDDMVLDIDNFKSGNATKPLSVKEYPNSFGFKVFPNPMENLIEIQADFDADGFSILDIKGNLMKKNQFDNFKRDFTVDISSLPKGTYFLTLTLKGKEVSKTLLKQ